MELPITDQNKLPYDSEMKFILQEMTKFNTDANDILKKLVVRKELEFSDYNQLLIKADNSEVLHVVSCPADKINEIMK